MMCAPKVSIIVPCRNEEKYIQKCLDSIINNDYPKDRLEILIAEGMSDDRTRVILDKYAREFQFIRILDNLEKFTPHALNLAIDNSKGDLILWMSAHNEYQSDYITKCVEYLDKYNADAVGGIIKPLPRIDNFIGQAISFAVSQPFGVGNSVHKIGADTPQWVDTAFGTCYKRQVFEKVGLFNERLTRGQDMEFGLRLKKSGFRTLLAPELISYYHLRSDLGAFIKHNFINGAWAILPFKYTDIMPVTLRHLVPLLFVISLLGSILLSVFLSFYAKLFLCIAVAYMAINSFFSLKLAVKEKDARLLFAMPFVFATLHLCYGLGSLAGLVICIFSGNFWKRITGFK